MELDELKAIWQRMEQYFERENRLRLEMLREQKMGRMRTSLRPLQVTMTLQIVAGVLVLLLAAALWSTKPAALPVILAGVVVHAYGIGCLITAGVVLAAIRRIDYAAPVVLVQSGLARVRRAYGIGVLVAGLTWWFLWVPLLMVLLGVVHVNLYAHAPSVIWIGLATGAAGWLGTRWFYAYSQKTANTRLRDFVDVLVFGASLRRAQEQLDEVRRFDREMA